VAADAVVVVVDNDDDAGDGGGCSRGRVFSMKLNATHPKIGIR
jgi:hypothetical protein